MSIRSILDHWHPVLLSRSLGNRPVGLQVAGEQFALFRTSSGEVGALSDVCPHRRMRLSAGCVVNDRLQCGYHGWTFSPDGDGESPGTPRLHARTVACETREAHGVIWLRAMGSTTAFPDFSGVEFGYVPMVCLQHDIAAPLELVLDNFNELEHTPTTHAMFGFPLERMREVELELEPADDCIRIRYRGPSKVYPWLFRKFLGLSRDVVFHVNGITRYSPVHTFGDYHWTDARTGKRSWVSVRNAHFLTPLDAGHTRLITFSFMRLERPGWNFLLPFVRPFMRHSHDKEIREDQRVLNGLADKQTSLAGLKLSRFDRVLGLNRERIERVYRGDSSASSEPEPSRTREESRLDAPGTVHLADLRPH